MWPQTILGWAQLVTYVVAIAAAVASVWQYRENSKRERTKWLHELYRGLYGDQELQDVLWRLEPENTGSEQELKKLIDEDARFASRFDRFLNFFQFIAVLVHERKELEMNEMMTMFKFPLKLILKRNAVVEYVRRPEHEFKELCTLLDREDLRKAD